MKKIVRQLALGFTGIMMAGIANAQLAANDKTQEEKIHSLNIIRSPFCGTNFEHRDSIDVYMSERALREIYLPGFKASVREGGAYTVMAACNKFRGGWCSENKYLDREILRKEFDFKGVLMTDWAAAHSTIKAALAGLDLEKGTDKKDYNEWYFANSLIRAVEEGKIPVAVVDEKVANVLRLLAITLRADIVMEDSVLK